MTDTATKVRDEAVEDLDRSWYGRLSEQTIERVAAMIRHRLDGKVFSIASAYNVEGCDTRLELRTGCRLYADWTDGSKQAVRVMTAEGGSKWLGFSAGNYFWSFHPPEDYPTRFDFDHGGFLVEFRAPCGDLHRYCFRVERHSSDD